MVLLYPVNLLSRVSEGDMTAVKFNRDIYVCYELKIPKILSESDDYAYIESMIKNYIYVGLI